VVDVHFVKDFVSEEIALAVTHVEGVHLALDHQHHHCSAPTRHGQFGELLAELEVQLKESLVHEHLHHLIQVTCLVQQARPFPHLSHQVVLDEFHTLRASMSVKHRKKADEFPLTASHVLLNQQSILHYGSKAYILTHSRIESGHFEGKISQLDLAMQGKRRELSFGNA
jgi:hypothetical protein